MFYQSWSLTLFAFFAFPLAIWPIKKIGKSIRKITYEIQNEIAKFSNVLAESIKGIRQVKAYNREEYEKKRAFTTINFIKKFFIRSAFVSNRLSPLMEFIGSLAVAVSIYAGGVFVLNESMTTGQFMSFLVSLLLAYQPVKALGNLNISVQEGLAGAERIFSLLDTSIEKSEKHESSKNIKLKGNIKFNDVNFSYTERKVLNNINLTVKKKETISIVGESGSGKTSSIMLIGGLEKATSGKIYFNNKDLTNLSEDKISEIRRKNIGIVFQSFYLIPNYSALENVALTLELNKFRNSNSQAKELLYRFGLKNRFNNLPSQLSGGEQQRVAIARAIAMKPELILADEPTGNLDSENSLMISKILFKYVAEEGSSLIMVTHDHKLANKSKRKIKIIDGKIS